MKHVRQVVTTLSVAAAAVLILAVVGSAAAAPSRATHSSRPSSASTADHIVSYKTPGPLLNAVQRTMQGDRVAGGGCVWHPPELSLGPDQRAIEARQMSADFTNCTTVVAIGTPTQI